MNWNSFFNRPPFPFLYIKRYWNHTLHYNDYRLPWINFHGMVKLIPNLSSINYCSTPILGVRTLYEYRQIDPRLLQPLSLGSRIEVLTHSPASSQESHQSNQEEKPFSSPNTCKFWEREREREIHVAIYYYMLLYVNTYIVTNSSHLFPCLSKLMNIWMKERRKKKERMHAHAIRKIMKIKQIKFNLKKKELIKELKD